MAHFRGTVQGSRGLASRLGGKASGLVVRANGWKAGVVVCVSHENGRDRFVVKRTTGSAGEKNVATLAVFDAGGAPKTTLLDYVIMYLQGERQEPGHYAHVRGCSPYDLLTDTITIKQMVNDAMSAYEGGAR